MPQPKIPPLVAFQCLDKKGADFAATIDDAVARYQARWGVDPDQIVVNPFRKDALGSEVTSHGLRLTVLSHRIISRDNVLVGVADPAVTLFKETN